MPRRRRRRRLRRSWYSSCDRNGDSRLRPAGPIRRARVGELEVRVGLGSTEAAMQPQCQGWPNVSSEVGPGPGTGPISSLQPEAWSPAGPVTGQHSLRNPDAFTAGPGFEAAAVGKPGEPGGKVWRSLREGPGGREGGPGTRREGGRGREGWIPVRYVDSVAMWSNTWS